MGKGFSVLKVKLGQDLEFDLELLQRLRAELPQEILLRVDPNQGYDLQALQALHQDSQVPEGMCAQQWEVEAPPAQDGQKLAILGSLPELGAWDMERAVTLVQKVSLSSASRVWTLTLRLPKGAQVEYKFLRMSAKGAAVWEDRVGNRVLEVGALTTIDGKPVPQKDSVQSFAGA